MSLPITPPAAAAPLSLSLPPSFSLPDLWRKKEVGTEAGETEPTDEVILRADGGAGQKKN